MSRELIMKQQRLVVRAPQMAGFMNAPASEARTCLQTRLPCFAFSMTHWPRVVYDLELPSPLFQTLILHLTHSEQQLFQLKTCHWDTTWRQTWTT